MKNKRIIGGFIISIALLLLTSCVNNSPGAASCNTTNTDMQLIQNNLLATGHVSEYLKKCDYGQIDFMVSSPKTICKIGFNGNDSAYATNRNYNVNVYDQSGTLVYTGSQLFSILGEYHSLTTPLTLVPNQPYIIRIGLTSPPPTPYFKTFSTIRTSAGTPVTFPRTSGVTTVLGGGTFGGANCTSLGGDYDLPRIDIVYQ